MAEIIDLEHELRKMPASEIRANPNNWRRHPPSQMVALKAVIDEVGFGPPIQAYIADDGVLECIDGHARLEIMGDQIVPVVVYLNADEAKAKQLLGTIDPLTMMAENDTDLLASLREQTSYEAQAINDLLEWVINAERDMPDLTGGAPQDDPGPQIDKAEELRKKWKVKKGQVWEIGAHRLMCGDCREEHELGAEAKLLLADPPYGISIIHVDGGSSPFGSTLPGQRAFGDWGKTQRGPKSKNQIIKANRYPVIEGDQEPFDPTHLLGLAEHTVLFGANYYADKLPTSSGWICWDKREQITRNTFADCELAWTSSSRPARVFSHLWNGLHKGSEHGEARTHPTQKPVALFEWILEQYTSEGDLVYDPYLGSGATMVACERLSRRCHAIEIEPLYVAVTLERMAGMGLEPRLV